MARTFTFEDIKSIITVDFNTQFVEVKDAFDLWYNFTRNSDSPEDTNFTKKQPDTIGKILNNEHRIATVFSSKNALQELKFGTSIKVECRIGKEGGIFENKPNTEIRDFADSNICFVSEYVPDSFETNFIKFIQKSAEDETTIINGINTGFLQFKLQDFVNEEEDIDVYDLNPKIYSISPFVSKTTKNFNNSQFIGASFGDSVTIDGNEIDFSQILLYGSFVPVKNFTQSRTKTIEFLNFLKTEGNGRLVAVPISVKVNSDDYYFIPNEYIHVRRIFPRISIKSSDEISPYDIINAFLNEEARTIFFKANPYIRDIIQQKGLTELSETSVIENLKEPRSKNLGTADIKYTETQVDIESLNESSLLNPYFFNATHNNDGVNDIFSRIKNQIKLVKLDPGKNLENTSFNSTTSLPTTLTSGTYCLFINPEDNPNMVITIVLVDVMDDFNTLGKDVVKLTYDTDDITTLLEKNPQICLHNLVKIDKKSLPLAYFPAEDERFDVNNQIFLWLKSVTLPPKSAIIGSFETKLPILTVLKHRPSITYLVELISNIGPDLFFTSFFKASPLVMYVSNTVLALNMNKAKISDFVTVPTTLTIENNQIMDLDKISRSIFHYIQMSTPADEYSIYLDKEWFNPKVIKIKIEEELKNKKFYPSQTNAGYHPKNITFNLIDFITKAARLNIKSLSTKKGLSKVKSAEPVTSTASSSSSTSSTTTTTTTTTTTKEIIDNDFYISLLEILLSEEISYLSLIEKVHFDPLLVDPIKKINEIKPDTVDLTFSETIQLMIQIFKKFLTGVSGDLILKNDLSGIGSLNSEANDVLVRDLNYPKYNSSGIVSLLNFEKMVMSRILTTIYYVSSELPTEGDLDDLKETTKYRPIISLFLSLTNPSRSFPFTDPKRTDDVNFAIKAFDNGFLKLFRQSDPFYYFYFKNMQDFIYFKRLKSANPSSSSSSTSAPKIVTTTTKLIARDFLKRAKNSQIFFVNEIDKVASETVSIILQNTKLSEKILSYFQKFLLEKILNLNTSNIDTRLFEEKLNVVIENGIPIELALFNTATEEEFRIFNEKSKTEDTLNYRTDFDQIYFLAQAIFKSNEFKNFLLKPWVSQNKLSTTFKFEINHQVLDIASLKKFNNNSTYIGQVKWTTYRNQFFKSPSALSYDSYMTRENQIRLLLSHLGENYNCSLASFLVSEIISYNTTRKITHTHKKNVLTPYSPELLVETMLKQLKDLADAFPVKTSFEDIVKIPWNTFILSNLSRIKRLYNSSFNIQDLMILSGINNITSSPTSQMVTMTNNIGLLRLIMESINFRTSFAWFIVKGLKILTGDLIRFFNWSRVDVLPVNHIRMRLIWNLILLTLSASLSKETSFKPSYNENDVNLFYEFENALNRRLRYRIGEKIKTTFNFPPEFTNYHYSTNKHLGLLWCFMGILPMEVKYNLEEYGNLDKYRPKTHTTRKNNVYVYTLQIDNLQNLPNRGTSFTDLGLDITLVNKSFFQNSQVKYSKPIKYTSSNGLILPHQLAIIKDIFFVLRSNSVIDWFYLELTPNTGNRLELKVYLTFPEEITTQSHLDIYPATSPDFYLSNVNPLEFNFNQNRKNNSETFKSYNIKKNHYTQLEWHHAFNVLSYDELNCYVIREIVNSHQQMARVGLTDTGLEKPISLLYGILDTQNSGICSSTGEKMILSSSDLVPATIGFRTNAKNKLMFVSSNDRNIPTPSRGYARNYQKPIITTTNPKLSNSVFFIKNDIPDSTSIPLVSQRYLNRVVKNVSGASDLGLFLSGVWSEDIKNRLPETIPCFEYHTVPSALMDCTHLPFERESFEILEDIYFKKFVKFIKSEWNRHLDELGVKGTKIYESRSRLSELVQGLNYYNPDLLIDNETPEFVKTKPQLNLKVGEVIFPVGINELDIDLYHHFNAWLLEYEIYWCFVMIPEIMKVSEEGILELEVETANIGLKTIKYYE